MFFQRSIDRRTICRLERRVADLSSQNDRQREKCAQLAKRLETLTNQKIDDEDEISELNVALSRANRYRDMLVTVFDQIKHLLEDAGEKTDTDPQQDRELSQPEIRSYLSALGIRPGTDNHYYCPDCKREVINENEIKVGAVNTRRLIDKILIEHGIRHCEDGRTTAKKHEREDQPLLQASSASFPGSDASARVGTLDHS